MFMIHWAKVLWVSDIRIYFCKMAGILGIRTKHIHLQQPASQLALHHQNQLPGWTETSAHGHGSQLNFASIQVFFQLNPPHKKWPQLGWWKDTTCRTILQNNQVLILWKLVNSHVFRWFLLYMPTEKLDLLQIHRSINTE